ncbi:MAG TPA: HAD family hydrolase, partial [Myxococcales bacterium]
VWMRDGWAGLNTLTSGAPVLPDAAVDVFEFSAGQADFEARVEVAPAKEGAVHHDIPKAIFFDAGNTLLRMNYAAIAAELARHGAAIAADALQRAEWRARVRLDLDLAAARGRSTESRGTGDRYVRHMLDEAGVTDEEVIAAVTAWRRGYNPPVGVWDAADPAALEALALARALGVRAAVISNSNGSVRAILDRLGLLSSLEFVLDSSELGMEKPDPRIFRLALERARLAPEEAVYVGDIYSVDVLGARAAGIRAVLLDPGGCWGARDCEAVPDVLAAVRLVLDGTTRTTIR